MEPVLVVAGCAAVAALTSALGVVPLIGRERLPTTWMGWANAAAAGAMLAGAYVLARAGIRDGQAVWMGLGALGGIAFISWSHFFSGNQELALNRLEDDSLSYGYEVLLMSALHSGAEGIAIGAAMAADLSFGIFLAVAMAAHNIPEATLLAAVYRARGVSLRRAALLAVISDVSLVFASVAAFAVLQAAPGALAIGLGFSAGALIYLVMVDLLPESYQQAGPTSIALVTILSMGLVAVIQQWLV